MERSWSVHRGAMEGVWTAHEASMEAHGGTTDRSRSVYGGAIEAQWRSHGGAMDDASSMDLLWKRNRAFMKRLQDLLIAAQDVFGRSHQLAE